MDALSCNAPATLAAANAAGNATPSTTLFATLTVAETTGASDLDAQPFAASLADPCATCAASPAATLMRQAGAKAAVDGETDADVNTDPLRIALAGMVTQTQEWQVQLDLRALAPTTAPSSETAVENADSASAQPEMGWRGDAWQLAWSSVVPPAQPVPVQPVPAQPASALSSETIETSVATSSIAAAPTTTTAPANAAGPSHAPIEQATWWSATPSSIHPVHAAAMALGSDIATQAAVPAAVPAVQTATTPWSPLLPATEHEATPALTSARIRDMLLSESAAIPLTLDASASAQSTLAAAPMQEIVQEMMQRGGFETRGIAALRVTAQLTALPVADSADLTPQPGVAAGAPSGDMTAIIQHASNASATANVASIAPVIAGLTNTMPRRTLTQDAAIQGETAMQDDTTTLDSTALDGAAPETKQDALPAPAPAEKPLHSTADDRDQATGAQPAPAESAAKLNSEPQQATPAVRNESAAIAPHMSRDSNPTTTLFTPPATAPAIAPAPVNAARADAAPAQRPPSAVDVAVTRHVARALSNVHHIAERPIIVRITPPELGTVRIELRMQDGAMHATLHADDDAVRQSLERMLPHLRADLREADGKPNEVTVARPSDRAGGESASGDPAADGRAWAQQRQADRDESARQSARDLRPQHLRDESQPQPLTPTPTRQRRSTSLVDLVA